MTLRPVEQVSAFAKAYLTSALGTTHGQAYLLDGEDTLIVASNSDPTGQQMRGQSLITAAGKAANGTLGSDYYVSAAIPASS